MSAASKPDWPFNALESLDMCRALIQEAKGWEGRLGGPITDHLDAAEYWLDEAETAIKQRVEASQ